MKKVITMMLAVVLGLSLAAVEGRSRLNQEIVSANTAVVSFADISTHWAKAQIEEAVRKGYVNGFPNGTFKPEDPVTRAQFIKMFVVALGLEHAPEGSTWYTTYVKAAKDAGMYHGDLDFPEWNMNKEISREHMAWLAVRAADESLVTVESSGVVKDIIIDRWPRTERDNKVTRSDEFMREYYQGFLVHTAFAKGILNGFGGSNIGLNQTTTRAQAVTVIERILSLRDGKALASDKYATAEAELLWLKTNAFTMAPHIFDDPKGISMKDNYKLENLVFKNSTIHTEISRIILIDLDDSKDPYRKLLPATNKLGFNNSNVGKIPDDAYAMYIEYETLYNHNPKQYWGDVHFSSPSYVIPSSYTADHIISQAYLFTAEKGFEHININSLPENGTGKNVTVMAIPNSGYKLYPNRGDRGQIINTPDRPLSFSITVRPINILNGEIRNVIFFGGTTHHDS